MTESPVVILTGASRGLGLAVLRILLEQHKARVVTISRSAPPNFRTVLVAHKDRCVHIQGDVGKVVDNENLINTTIEKWGKLDSVIVCAGTMSIERIGDLDLNALAEYTSLNLLSIPYLLKPALSHLRQSKGKIVLVSSGASTKGYAGWGMYSMVKAGMNSFSRTLAAEEKDSGVGVWAIRPGLVDTGVRRSWYPTPADFEQMQEYLREAGPGKMTDEDMNKFTTAFEQGKLLPPEQPGAVIASVAVNGGPADLCGEYLDWTDERLGPRQ